MLKTRWRIGPELLPEVQESGRERLAPTRVRVFAEEGYPERPERIRLLCAQATSLGDRYGVYDGLGYGGPWPIETFLSDACWDIVEGRQTVDGDADKSCARMEAPIQRVLAAAGQLTRAVRRARRRSRGQPRA